MNSGPAEELRLILPLLLRLATLDFVGIDDFRDLVDVLLGFDDVLFDEDRDEDDRGRPPFWATTVNGRRSMAAASATPMRLSIPNLLWTLRLSEVKQDEARESSGVLINVPFFSENRTWLSAFAHLHSTHCCEARAEARRSIPRIDLNLCQ